MKQLYDLLCMLSVRCPSVFITELTGLQRCFDTVLSKKEEEIHNKKHSITMG